VFKQYNISTIFRVAMRTYRYQSRWTDWTLFHHKFRIIKAKKYQKNKTKNVALVRYRAQILPNTFFWFCFFAKAELFLNNDVTFFQLVSLYTNSCKQKQVQVKYFRHKRPETRVFWFFWRQTNTNIYRQSRYVYFEIWCKI
jgi:hypothetical protein